MHDLNHDRPLLVALRDELLRLAQHEDDRASTEAAAAPYWSPLPADVVRHRAAADALREQAERFALRLATP